VIAKTEVNISRQTDLDRNFWYAEPSQTFACGGFQFAKKRMLKPLLLIQKSGTTPWMC
jgi:hypothetical protein